MLRLTFTLLALFLANEYIRAQRLPGFADDGQVEEVHKDIQHLAERYIGVASGKLDVDDDLLAG
jgi:hypothetical protein